MKKLLALGLSVMMAASLAVPAFAAPDAGASPEEAAPISAILDDSLGLIGGADGPTAIITSTPGNVSVSNEVYDPEAYLASHPGLEEELRASAYDYFDQEYLYWGSAEEYMEWLEVTEEEFLDQMVLAQVFDLMDQELRQQWFDNTKKALGGVPGQIGVMVNGAYVQFPDAVPEITNGRTMVPVRAVVEALGGEVSAYGADVRCRLNGLTVIFTIGSKEAVVELEADADEGCEQVAGVLEMDCAPYVKGGRTYVPVRFIGEALGYGVYWEDNYETAVLMDPEVLVEEIDQDFTILNRVLAAAANTREEGKNYRFDQKGDVTFTAFDTLNGNKTYTASFTGKELLNTEAANGTYSITMSDNAVDALMELVMGGEGPEYEEDAAILRSVITGLKEFEIIMTREGLMWVHAPALDELAGEKNVWCGMGLGEDMSAALSALNGTGTVTVGQLVTMSSYSSSFVTVWAEALETAEQLAAVMGDGCFTTTGGTSTLTIDMDSLDPDGELGLKQELKECALTLKVDGKGGASLSCKVQTAEGRTLGMRLSMDCTLTDRQVSLTVDAHVANVGEMKLSLSSQWRTTSEEPVSEPPEGAIIVDAPMLLDGGSEQ